MNIQTRHFVHGAVLVLALVLMVGGIVTETDGAVVIGLIVAAVSFGTWQKRRKA